MGHERVGLLVFRVQLKRSGVVQESCDDRVQTVDLVTDDLKHLFRLGAEALLFEHLCRALYTGQRVSDLVRESRRERADGGQPMLLLKSFKVSDIEERHRSSIGHPDEPVDLLGGVSVAPFDVSQHHPADHHILSHERITTSDCCVSISDRILARVASLVACRARKGRA